MLNFKHQLPTTKTKIKEKFIHIQRFLSGKISQADLEESQLKGLDEKLKQGRIDQINVPYQKAKLDAEIETFESSIRKV